MSEASAICCAAQGWLRWFCPGTCCDCWGVTTARVIATRRGGWWCVDVAAMPTWACPMLSRQKQTSVQFWPTTSRL
jgi:hypothetical protein